MGTSTYLLRLIRDWIYVTALAALVAVVLGSAVLSGGGDDATAAPQVVNPVPTATETPRPAPTAVPTPELWQQLLDTRRVLDLGTLADALKSYHARYGAYPSTRSAVENVCAGGTGAGCALAAVKAGLPYNDGTYNYLYRSDGATFTLYTRLEWAMATDGCAGDHPDALAGMPVYCKTGGQ